MSVEREIGRLSGLVEGMSKDITSLQADVQILVKAEAQRSGAWKVTLGAGAFAGAVVAFVANFLEVIVRRS